MDLIVGVVGFVIVVAIFRLLIREARPSRTGIIQGSGDYGCEVVGESRYQDALERIVGERTEDGAEHECIAQIVPEPKNRHDRNAMRIDIDGATVGYLSRGDAVILRKLLRDQGVRGAVSAGAMIVGGWRRGTGRGRRDLGSFGVRLDVPIDEGKVRVMPE